MFYAKKKKEKTERGIFFNITYGIRKLVRIREFRVTREYVQVYGEE
jgi:hypothetical protein